MSGLWLDVAGLAIAWLGAGAALGLAAGLLGTGGGLLAVPLLMNALEAGGAGVAPHAALAGAAASVAALSLRAWLARGGTIAPAPAGAAAAGGLLAGGAAAFAPPATLTAVLGLAVAVGTGVAAAARLGRDAPPPLASPYALPAFSGLIGALSGGAGLGGGAFGPTLLRRVGTPDPDDLAPLLGALGGGAGALALAALGPHAPAVLVSVGALDPLGAALAAAAAAAAAPYGARLAAQGPATALRWGTLFAAGVSGVVLLRAGLIG